MYKANDISMQTKDINSAVLSDCQLDEKNVSQSNFGDIDVSTSSVINDENERIFQNLNINSISKTVDENNGNNENDAVLHQVQLCGSELMNINLKYHCEDANKNEISNVAILDLSSEPEIHSIAMEEPMSSTKSILKPINLNDNCINEKSHLESNPKNNYQISNTANNQPNMNTPSVEYRQQIVKNQSSGITIPIIGYEIMEERARFTIYKLRIDDPRTGLSWMVFRRYTDFVRLYSKLKMTAHPTIYLPLPGKRWFKDNFDPRFLDDRIRGLQLFINAVVKNLSHDPMVRDFFCLDEPPPVCDSEPESLALFSALEDTVKSLKNQLRQKEETLTYLKNKVTYFEEKMKCCENCNPGGGLIDDKKNNPGTSGSSSR